MNRLLVLMAGILLFATSGFSQITNVGGPVAWKGKLPSHIIIPVETMPGFDMEQVVFEDSINDANKIGMWRFGYEYETDITLENSGIWTELPSGGKLWRTKLSCPGALTINVIFENFNLPEGAHLHLYDVDQTNLVGAYTSRNNRADGLLGSELVHGDEIIVEYFEPANVAGQGNFTISTVVHGYRGAKEYADNLMKGINDSGPCNIDVECPLGDAWDDQIRSVGMLVSGGGFCSGALINNTCDDGTPYFLTADHCGTASGTWNVRFNWESPPGTESCATTAGSTDPGMPYDQTSNGCTPVVQNGGSDFNLITIDNLTLVDAQNWNLFYAGWDNSDALTVTSAVGIHHPSGDVKKICLESNAPTHTTWSGADVWECADWDQGVTEGGSSGSPLFDQNGRIIGQLYGGGAACSGTNDNGQPDWYGRFGTSWNLGASTYLNPGCATTPVTNDGYDPNSPAAPDDAGITTINAPTGSLCDDNFDPSVVIRNYGSNNLTSAVINYDIDGGANNTFNWTGNLAPGTSETVNLPNMTTTAGAHTFNAYTTLPNGIADSDASNDGSSSNYTATIGGQPITLEIQTDCWGEEVFWEIMDGATQVASGGNTVGIPPGGQQVASNADPGAYGDEITITENLCLAEGCYDFIIYDDYGDGMFGSQWGCAVDGTYTITDDNTSTVLASMINQGADYDSETNNFCVTSPCGMTITTSETMETCYGDNTGSITVNVTGGNAPLTYDIGGGQQASNVFNGLTAGNYSITIEDATACSSVIDVTLNGPNELTGTSTAIDETCPGVADGSIEVTAAGGTGTLMYDIGSGQQAGNIFNGLSPNTYNLTVTDDNGCTYTENGIVIGTGSGVTATGTVTDVTCNGDTDGQILVVPSNGTGPFTYDIGAGGQGSDTFTNLSPGSYTIDITDDNGCTGQINETVGEPAVVSGTTNVTDEATGFDGAIDLTPTGGTPTYNYSWSGPNSYTASSEDISGLESGFYDVTITDANGCTGNITGIEVRSSVGIEEGWAIEFSLYPNPSNGFFNIQLREDLDAPLTVSVVDVTGRLVYQTIVVNENTFTVDISDKASGTYYLRLSTGDQHSVVKLVNN